MKENDLLVTEVLLLDFILDKTHKIESKSRIHILQNLKNNIDMLIQRARLKDDENI